MIDSIHTELKFPDDLVFLWNAAHYHQSEMLANDIYEAKWIAVQTMLCKYLRNTKLPGITKEEDVQDAAKEYLIYLFSESCPDYITSNSILTTRMRQYLARKRNPVQYEMSMILYSALRSLENNGKVKRDENSKGKKISAMTLFQRTDSKSDSRGTRTNYEEYRKNIPFYKTVIRANDPEHSRIIPQESARDLVMNLLKAFGGWTNIRDLLWAMQFHVPDQLNFVAEQDLAPEKLDSDSPASSPILNFPKDQSETFVYDSDQEFIAMNAAETAQRIWDRVSKVSDKVFCLYFLPDYLPVSPNYSVKLADLGPTSTVGDQNKKITQIMRDELKDYKSYFSDSDREKIAMKKALKNISLNLHRNCTEKGHNVPLLFDETGKEQ